MRRLLTAFAIVTAVGFAACSDDGTGPDQDRAPGEYHLMTIDGDSLPYTLFYGPGDNDSRQLIAGDFILLKDGTFETMNIERQTLNGFILIDSIYSSGTYTHEDDGSGVITFSFGVAVPFTFGDQRMRFTFSEMVFSFEK